MATETDDNDALLIAAARRLDAITQYAPPPIDRNMERVADWLRQGVGMTADNQAGYVAAARALLDKPAPARVGVVRIQDSEFRIEAGAPEDDEQWRAWIEGPGRATVVQMPT